MFAVANDEMDMIFAEAKQRLSEMTQVLEKAENEIHAGRFSYADPALRRLLSLIALFVRAFSANGFGFDEPNVTVGKD